MKGQRLITLGSFDGVHRGHSVLIDRAVLEAKHRHARPAALTFELPPKMVLDRSHAISILSDQVEKEILLRSRGLREVIVQPFNVQFSKIKPYVFFRDLLLQRYRAAGLVVGLDFRFGVNRSAGVMELVRWGQERRIPVWVIPPVKLGKTVVSSTEIRQLLSNERYDQAVRLMGHSYLIHGSVVRGRGVGKRIGYPTTNLSVAEGKVLPRGVFAVVGRVWGRKKGELQTGVCNVGTRPTFLKKSQVVVEIHWLSGRPPKAGNVVIELVKRLRGEKKFSTPRALGRAIDHDIRRSHQILSKTAKNALILKHV